jgi:hypothetical protein
VILAGCSSHVEVETPRRPSSPLALDQNDDLLAALEKYKLERDKSDAAHPRDTQQIQLESAVAPFIAEGTFVPSGWMGDAAHLGMLRYELCGTAPCSDPTCDKWVYLPPSESSELGWVAVAYQGPTANNWGSEKGMDFSGRGFTRLTFMARGEHGGERVVVKSGGCTSAAAPFPASYEVTIGTIVLSSGWTQFEIPLDKCDLSNTCALFAFTISRSMAPQGSTIYVDDLALRAPPERE